MNSRLNKKFNVIVFKREADKVSLKNYFVLLVPKSKDSSIQEILIKAEDLLYMIPGKEIRSVHGDVKITMPSIKANPQALDFVTIENLSNEVYVEYRGFHRVRQIVRAKLSEKGKNIKAQLERLNKEIALAELQTYKSYYDSYYDSVQGDERKFFSVYFRERFPEDSKGRFGGNIGEMFWYYNRYFFLPGLPSVKVYKTDTIFRTSYRDYLKTDRYSYPIEVGYFVEEPSYMAKVVVCTVKEMGIPFPMIE